MRKKYKAKPTKVSVWVYEDEPTRIKITNTKEMFTNDKLDDVLEKLGIKGGSNVSDRQEKACAFK